MLQGKIKLSLPNLVFSLIFIGCLIWSFTFILHSSLICIDGKRYFCLFDDAMISMRYAWNFAHGNGLVWNIGERVEGYSNFLMTLIMSVFAFLFDKKYAVFAVQLLGIIFIVLYIAFVTRIINNIDSFKYDHSSNQGKIIVFFSTFCYYPLLYWSLMGMETGLLSFLLSVSLFLTIKKNKTSTNLYVNSIILSLAYLTRPDAVIFAFLSFAFIFIDCLRSSDKVREDFYALFKSFGIFSAVIIVYFLFRLYYYNTLLPNTYTLKIEGMDLKLRIVSGYKFVIPFLSESKWVLILFVIFLVLNFNKEKLFLFLNLVLLIFYQIWTGGDPWNYWRFFAPIMPILLACLSLDIFNFFLFNKYLEAIKRKALLRKLLLSISLPLMAVVIILFIIYNVNYRFIPEFLFQIPIYQVPASYNDVNRSIVLNEVTTKDATVAVFRAGTIPYYTERKSIDILGKCDPYIAQLTPDTSGAVSWFGMKSVPGHNKYDLNYSIKQRKPTFVQDFAWGRQNLQKWSENNYCYVTYKGMTFNLLKNSPQILWNKFDENAILSQ